MTYSENKLLQSMFKIGTLVLFITMALTLLGCSFTTQSNNSDHVSKSINYSNRAALVLNQKGRSLNQTDMEQIVELKKQALDEALLVDIEQLNTRYENFGDQWRDKYTQGLKLFIEGVAENDNRRSLQGQVLLDEWGKWYSNNVENIRSN